MTKEKATKVPEKQVESIRILDPTELEHVCGGEPGGDGGGPIAQVTGPVVGPGPAPGPGPVG